MKTNGKSQSNDSQQAAAQSAQAKPAREAAAAPPPFTHRTPNRLHASFYARERR